MKHWQKYRNYRKFESENGDSQYIITVDDLDVEVTQEVFLAYSQADRRERYCDERDKGRLISLDQMEEHRLHSASSGVAPIESAENTALQRVQTCEISEAITRLCPFEQSLIKNIYMHNLTERECAHLTGISQVAIHKRKRNALKKLLKCLDTKIS